MRFAVRVLFKGGENFRPMAKQNSIWQSYLLRLKRKRLIWRSFRSRRDLAIVQEKPIPKSGVLLFCVLRNEATRLPYFLDFYRQAGVSHFLFVDNGSDDGTSDLLAGQSDCSVWHTEAQYRHARFGLDWLSWLFMKYGHNRWCLMADVDELLVYDGCETQKLPDLVTALEEHGHEGFGAMMLDLYPAEALGLQAYAPGQDPLEVLTHFDPAPYRQVRQEPKGNLWLQGGMRERVFFQDMPERSPTLNKIPLIKWHRTYAWVNSCHSLLPRGLNFLYDGPEGDLPSGAMLHTKFLPEIVSKSETERHRGQHFHTPAHFDAYYQAIEKAPVLMGEVSVKYQGPAQLAELGLASRRDKLWRA